MISSNDFRNGITIDLEGILYTIIEFQHVKPGKGSAFVRTKLKNVRTGYTVDKTFRAGEKVGRAIVERREMQFLYKTDDEYTFMDVKTFEQFPIVGTFLGDSVKYLKDSMLVSVLMHDTLTLGVDLPNFVELKVLETEPGFKGDTATGASKPAKMETGHTINVPLFVEEGDVLLIDTRSGDYMKRV